MIFELVRYHAHGAMDNVNPVDLPAFKVQPAEAPIEGVTKADTLFVIDGTRKQTYFVEALPGDGVGQYTPA